MSIIKLNGGGIFQSYGTWPEGTFLYWLYHQSVSNCHSYIKWNDQRVSTWFNVGTMIPAIANMGEAPYMIDIETSRSWKNTWDDHGLYCKNNGRINVVIPIPWHMGKPRFIANPDQCVAQLLCPSNCHWISEACKYARVVPENDFVWFLATAWPEIYSNSYLGSSIRAFCREPSWHVAWNGVGCPPAKLRSFGCPSCGKPVNRRWYFPKSLTSQTGSRSCLNSTCPSNVHPPCRVPIGPPWLLELAKDMQNLTEVFINHATEIAGISTLQIGVRTDYMMLQKQGAFWHLRLKNIYKKLRFQVIGIYV